jgi:hypothetical protein
MHRYRVFQATEGTKENAKTWQVQETAVVDEAPKLWADTLVEVNKSIDGALTDLQ